LTETLRVIDAAAPADILGAACPPEGVDARHGKIDGKTMRASKDGDGNTSHVLSAFCAGSRVNRSHWGIEIMHRDKAVTLGEDGYTDRSDNAPRNVFSLLALALKVLKSVSSSPVRAIEYFQDDRNRLLRLFAG
jgi:hypothetical protein